MAVLRGVPSDQQDNLSFRDSLAALKTVPKFFRLVWETDRAMTFGNVMLRILSAALPLALLFVGKLIIDEVILLAGQQCAALPSRCRLPVDPVPSGR